MNKIFKSSMFTSVILFFLGLFLIFQSEATIATISYIIGAILIAAGTFAFIRYLSINTKGIDTTDLDVLYGLVSIILGILIITNPHAIASIIPIILGIGIIIGSATKINYAFSLKAMGSGVWKMTLCIALISTICGVVLLFNPFAGAVLLMRIVGIFIVVYAILDFISTYIIRKNVMEFKSIMDSEVNVEFNSNDTIDAEVVEEKENDSSESTKEVDKKEKKKATKKPTKKKNKKDSKKKDE